MDKQTKQESLIARRMLILLLVYTLCRVLFFIAYRDRFSSGSSTDTFMDFIHGIRFDISAIVFTNGIFILLHLFPLPFFYRPGYQKFLKFIFYLFNVPALLLNCIDLVYYRFTLKRTTGDIFQYLGLGSDFGHMLPQYAKDFWYVLVVVALMVMLMEYLYRKMDVYTYSVRSKKQTLVRVVAGVASIPLFVIGARGGLQYKPLSILNAGQYSSPQNAPLILNTPFTFVKTLGNSNLKDMKYMSPMESTKWFNPVKCYTGGQAKPMNVVLIILEGFGKEFIGSLNHYEGYTPFLDSLIPHSLVLTNAFANGKRSIEGIPAIIASMPTLMNNAYITSAYSGNQINSLASLLRENGYSTAFYHGGNNGTMGFDIFSSMAGFERYYGRNEYGNDADYDGNWGIYDEPFLQYFAGNLSKTPSPFFASIFTLSSHHPFKLPPQYEGKFKKGTLPIHPTVMYTDMALKRFFRTASAQSWYQNTLFVITADHTSLNEYPFYQTVTGDYSIPILFYKPSDPAMTGKITTTAQQTDIMPTVLKMLNFDKPFVAFGQNVLDSTKTHFAVNFVNDGYQLIADGYSLQHNGTQSTGLYQYTSDSTLSKNLVNTAIQKKEQLENQLKAVIQEYNARLIHNQLTVK